MRRGRTVPLPQARPLKQSHPQGGGEAIYSVYTLDGTLVHRDEVRGGVSTGTDFVRAGGELVARVKDKPSGSVFLRYYHADHLGSPVAQTRPDGAVTWREAYTPYGEEWSRSGMWDDRPGFTGHVHDEDTGLTYMQARFYEPVAPRFLSPDPVTFGPMGSMDPAMFGRYHYAANDPVNMWDPDGRQVRRQSAQPAAHERSRRQAAVRSAVQPPPPLMLGSHRRAILDPT